MTEKLRPTVAVIGASADRAKMSNKAVRAYASLGYQVYPVHPKETVIEGFQVYKTLSQVPVKPDVVTLYLPPAVGLKVLPDVARAGPSEFYVNPGAESPELEAEAARLGLEPIYACSIIARGLSAGAF